MPAPRAQVRILAVENRILLRRRPNYTTQKERAKEQNRDYPAPDDQSQNLVPSLQINELVVCVCVTAGKVITGE